MMFLATKRHKSHKTEKPTFVFVANMHPVIYLNKTMVEATKARVAPVSSAML
jgi:hypothetical protein